MLKRIFALLVVFCLPFDAGWQRHSTDVFRMQQKRFVPTAFSENSFSAPALWMHHVLEALRDRHIPSVVRRVRREKNEFRRLAFSAKISKILSIITSKQLLLSAFFVIVSWTVVSEAIAEKIYLEPFSVPAIFLERGFSASQLADDIRAKIAQMQKVALAPVYSSPFSTLSTPRYEKEQAVKITSIASKPVPLNTIAIPKERPNFQVPGTGFSFGKVVHYIEHFLNLEPASIKGYVSFPKNGFVSDAHSATLEISFTVTQKGADSSVQRVLTSAENYDVFIEDISKSILRRTDPHIAAMEAYNRDPVHNADEALLLVQEALQEKRTRFWGYLIWSTILIHQGKWQDAESKVRMALQMDHKKPEAYLSLGLTFMGQGKYDKAIEAYNQALSMDSHYAPAYNNKGVALSAQGSYIDAQVSFSYAITVGHMAVAYYNLGVVEEGFMEFAKSGAAYKKAIELDPTYAPAYYNLAGLQVKQINGDLDVEIANYRKAVELNPSYLEAYSGLAQALEKKGDLAGAVEAYKKMIELKPEDPFYYKWLAEALIKKGDLKDALAAILKGLELQPTNYNLLNLQEELQKLLPKPSVHLQLEKNPSKSVLAAV